MPVIELPFRGQKGRPELSAVLRSMARPPLRPLPVKFLLDSGSDVTLVGKSAWGLWRVPPKAIGPPKTIHGIGGATVANPVGPVRMTIHELAEIHVFEMDKVYLLDEQPGQAGSNLLGHDFFEKFGAVFTLDYRLGSVRLDFARTTKTLPRAGIPRTPGHGG